MRHTLLRSGSVWSRLGRLAAYLLRRDARLPEFVAEPPAHRNAAAIFDGEWISQLPHTVAGPVPGALPLFADARVAWGLETLGGVAGRRVLELGPLEAGHTFMLHERGAGSILGIESSPRFYLKCLVVKEMLGLSRATFLCGDFVPFLRQTTDRFDVCLASGVLYHMRNPVELLADLAGVTDRLYLWTHYYDADRIATNPRWRGRVLGSEPAETSGFPHTLHRLAYGRSRLHHRFMGGEQRWSHWLSRGEMLDACRHVGFDRVVTGFETPDHPNGPCFAVAASRADR